MKEGEVFMELKKINRVNIEENNATKMAKCTCYCYCFVSKATGYASMGVQTGLTTMAAKGLFDFIFKRKY